MDIKTSFTSGEFLKNPAEVEGAEDGSKVEAITPSVVVSSTTATALFLMISAGFSFSTCSAKDSGNSVGVKHSKRRKMIGNNDGALFSKFVSER